MFLCLTYLDGCGIIYPTDNPERRGFCPADAKSVRPLQVYSSRPLQECKIYKLGIAIWPYTN